MTIFDVLLNDPNNGYFKISVDTKTGTEELLYEPAGFMQRIILCLKRMASWLMPSLLQPYDKALVAKLIEGAIKHDISLDQMTQLAPANLQKVLENLATLKKRFLKSSFCPNKVNIEKRLDHAIRRLKDHELSSAGAFGEKLYCMFINRDTYQQYLLGSEVFGNCDIAVDNATPHFKKWTFALFELVNTFLTPSDVVDRIHSLKTEHGGILCSLPKKAKEFTNLSVNLDKKENYQLLEALPAALQSGDLETVEKNILSLNKKVVDAVIDFSVAKDPWLKKREQYFKEFFHFYFDQKIKLEFYYSYKIAFIRQDLLDKRFSIGDCDAATKKVLEKWKSDKGIPLYVALSSLKSYQHKEFDEEMQTFLRTELAKDDADAIIKPIPVIDRDHYAKTYSERFNQSFKVLKLLAEMTEAQKA